MSDTPAESPALAACAGETQLNRAVASLFYLVNFITQEAFGCGGSRRIAEALASLYNGDRVQANLWDLSYLDNHLIEHLLAVIRLHCTGGREIHTYFDGRPGQPGGNQVFEGFIRSYGLEGRRQPPLDSHQVYNFRRFAAIVGGKRFTLQDAWYAITGNAKHVFPRPDDRAGIRWQLLNYQREGLVAYSEGPKGGEGWELTALGSALIPPATAQQGAAA